MSPIEPIETREIRVEPLARVQRPEERRRDGADREQRRRHEPASAPVDDDVPDDGLPHIDIRA